MVETFYITNARVILADRIISPGQVVVKGKKIAAVNQSKSVPRGAVKINARGNFLAAGFIDLHIHGEIKQVSRQQAKGGTTGFLATLHPAGAQALLKNIARVLAETEQVSGAKVLGLRLEGPFLNRDFCGALPPETLRCPDINEAKKLIKKAGATLKIVVVAPELKGSIKLIRFLKKRKVITSIGHTGATYKEAIRGIDAGIAHATHTFNRMRAFKERDPGALGAVLTDQRVACEVIADGVHVHPAALKLLFECKGVDKVILVTDSTAAQDHPPKRRCGDVFKLKDGTLYGTALTLNQALKNIVKFLGLTVVEAVKLVTLNPAKVLRIEQRKGSIASCKDADLVIFDKDFNVKMTIAEGKIIYKA